MTTTTDNSANVPYHELPETPVPIRLTPFATPLAKAFDDYAAAIVDVGLAAAKLDETALAALHAKVYLGDVEAMALQLATGTGKLDGKNEALRAAQFREVCDDIGAVVLARDALAAAETAHTTARRAYEAALYLLSYRKDYARALSAQGVER